MLSRSCRGTRTDEWFPKMTFAMVTPSRVGALNGVSAAGSRPLPLISRRVRVLQNDGACLQQGLEVGDDLRPAAGHRRDEFRGFALDGVGDGELDRRSTGFQFHRAARLAFGLEFGLVLMLPADHQAPWRLGLDDLAGVEDLTVAGHQLPRGSRRPLAFAAHAEPVLLYELCVGQC